MPGGFPGGSVVKNPPANAGDTGDVGSIPGLGRFPGVEKFLPEKSHEQRSLVGHSQWDHKEANMTEHTYTHTLNDICLI